MGIEVRKPTEAETARAKAWPVWTSPVTEFDWQYDKRETCLILKGKVTVTHAGGSASFGPGDWVVFPQGLSCRWKVESPVEKHYNFG